MANINDDKKLHPSVVFIILDSFIYILYNYVGM